MQHGIISHNNSVARRHVVGIAFLLLVAILPATIFAQALPLNRLKSGRTILKLLQPVVEASQQSMVRISNDKDDLALGTIVDANGYIITKASLLTDDAVCHLNEDEEAYKPLVVAVDKEHDVALLKIDANDLHPISWKKKVDFTRGQWLITPGMKSQPITVGVVGVTARKIRKRSGVLGIQIEQVEGGARIVIVFPKSSAERAGLKKGDIVTQISGTEIKTREALVMLVRKQSPGDMLKLHILRGEEDLVLNATLGNPPKPMMSRGARQNQMGGKLSFRRAGFPEVIQHDSVLKPEECGGAVLNIAGEAVGLNIARAGRTESYAIPAAKIVELIKQLKTSGATQHVSDQPVEPAASK